MSKKCVGLAVLLLGAALLTACQGGGPKAPAAPARPPVELRYPDALPPGARDCAAYQMAVDQGMLMRGEEPATDGALARWFLEEAAAGREAQLSVALFSAPWGDGAEGALVVDRFTSRDGGVYHSTAYLESWSKTDLTFEEDGKVEGLHLNDYGHLVYEIPGMTGPFGVPVIHGRELYPNYDASREIYEAYLRPIYYTALGATPWQTPGELNLWLWLYEDISNYEGQNPFDLYGTDWPVEAILSTLGRYFENITRGEILADKFALDAYNAATDTIHYEGGRGGGPKPLRVLDWTQQGDLLEIRYVGYEEATGVPYNDEYLLTVKKLPDGSFYYRSNGYAPYVNRFARDAFLDPARLRPQENGAFLSDYQPEGIRLELRYGDRWLTADPAPILEREQSIYPGLGAFVTAPKTAIIFGGGPDSVAGLPVAVMISEDMGATWDVHEIPDSTPTGNFWGGKQIGFTTPDSGWLLLSEPDTTGAEHHRLYTTADGGKTWARGTVPDREGWASCAFVSPTVGFLGYGTDDGSHQPLWRTTDGGQSWQRLTLPMQQGAAPQEVITPMAADYTWGRVEVPLRVTVDGVPMDRTYTSWDNGESWRFPVKMPAFEDARYGAVTVVRDGREEAMEHPYEGQGIKRALQSFVSQDCLALGADPEALLPGYGRLEQTEFRLTGPQAQWSLKLWLGEGQALAWQSGDPDHYYLVEQPFADGLLQECMAAKTQALERERIDPPQDYTDPEFRRQALEMGYTEEYLDFRQKTSWNLGELLTQDAAGVTMLMQDFGRYQAFINKLLGMSWDELGARTDGTPVFTADGQKGVFFCYGPDEYASPTYLIWCDRQTGETRWLGAPAGWAWALDKTRDLLVVSGFEDLLTFDMETGEAVPPVYDFDFGSRLADGQPQRVVRGLGYDGFADRFVVLYTENPYDDWVYQEPMLAVYRGGGEHLRDVPTGRIVISSYKNFPTVAQFVNFTAQGHIRTQLGVDELLDMKY